MKEHFTIRVPSSKNGAARKRTVYVKKFFSSRKNKLQIVTAFVIYFSAKSTDIEFHLFRSKDGQWSCDPEGELRLNDEVLLAIKKEILRNE
jgi:hypothetical protein